MLSRLLPLLPLLILTVPPLAPTLQDGPHPLELQIHADDPDEGGVAQQFTVVLVNQSDHDIRLPAPMANCQSAFTGSVSLIFRFIPRDPRTPATGSVCIADSMAWPPILERVNDWKILGPEESLTFRIKASDIACQCHQPGKYEFWAGYAPPSMSDEDKTTLTEAGIDFPHSGLESAHLVFEATQE
jgi:hypothetical protein